MLLFNGVESHKFFQHASAYHDHGHENNPMVPRWEDTRSGGGFNYRMSELQGAVGIAQLEKLTGIVDAQRAIARKISNILEKYSGISFVQSPKDANPTYDGFVFFVESPAIAKMFRSKLLEIGISTKILPEAMTWHFSKYWTHLPTLVNTGNSCNSSNDILSRAVSIPVSLKADDSYFDKLELVSSRIFKGSK